LGRFGNCHSSRNRLKRGGVDGLSQPSRTFALLINLLVSKDENAHFQLIEAHNDSARVVPTRSVHGLLNVLPAHQSLQGAI